MNDQGTQSAVYGVQSTGYSVMGYSTLLAFGALLAEFRTDHVIMNDLLLINCTRQGEVEGIRSILSPA